MAEKLLPCPFCNSTNIDQEGWKSSDGTSGPACDDCCGSANSIVEWNTRPREGSPPPAVEGGADAQSKADAQAIAASGEYTTDGGTSFAIGAHEELAKVLHDAAKQLIAGKSLEPWQGWIIPLSKAADLLEAASSPPAVEGGWRFKRGAYVRKVVGSKWNGRVVGFYTTELTQRGYAVESMYEIGSVQIYPEKALELFSVAPTPPAGEKS